MKAFTLRILKYFWAMRKNWNGMSKVLQYMLKYEIKNENKCGSETLQETEKTVGWWWTVGGGMPTHEDAPPITNQPTNWQQTKTNLTSI